MAHDVRFRSGSAADFDAVVALLARAKLPVADLSAASISRFLVATIDESIAALIGLECFGSIGLLRSLVVDPEFRGAGLGRVLVEKLESQASDQGISQLWLLTIDADGWFQRLGYEARRRDEAPALIAQTAEFVSLCPGDAVLMHKAL